MIGADRRGVGDALPLLGPQPGQGGIQPVVPRSLGEHSVCRYCLQHAAGARRQRCAQGEEGPGRIVDLERVLCAQLQRTQCGLPVPEQVRVVIHEGRIAQHVALVLDARYLRRRHVDMRVAVTAQPSLAKSLRFRREAVGVGQQPCHVPFRHQHPDAGEQLPNRGLPHVAAIGQRHRQRL